ncbi:DUF4351 domain-containing protein [Calothrix sp. PCC 6303]|uniref:DUF4351 domain-containing protein n=1 Tax=Calothrix sp. PCC 6303 TaxID=1170562 RepID=UPI0002A04E5B|nr:DUF4351 domain-containing protein [Calothrix sp. PCC 6303]AFZ01456.1 hypothetical protein Cal6303_2460 [Calothrix sp. PCC 6303]
MTRFPHDEFAKGFLESLLSPFGKVQTSFKIGSEVREVDIYFQPNPQVESDLALGLLGKLAKNSLIFEPFRNPVKTQQIRFCMGKLYDLHADLFRESKRNKQPEPKDSELPCLWILTPTLSEAILDGYGAKLAPEFTPAGVYLVNPSYKFGIVVIHQLQKTPETLWFRLLGKGNVQSEAIVEVAKLPENHPCRQNALDWLGNLKVILESREVLEPEERDLMMQLSPLYLEKIRAAESLGRQEGQCELLLRLLNRRVGSLSPEMQDQVKALTLARLEELGEALLDFTSLTDLETWLNQLH